MLWRIMTMLAVISALVLSMPVWSQTAVAPMPSMATISTVTTVDAGGRISQFQSSNGRIFQVSYDGLGHPRSVQAIGQPNIADITSIGYDDQGRLLGFRLRTGYSVYCSYGADGTQRIHDNLGGQMVRQPAGPSAYVVISSVSGNGHLQESISAMDNLTARLSATQAVSGS